MYIVRLDFFVQYSDSKGIWPVNNLCQYSRKVLSGKRWRKRTKARYTLPVYTAHIYSLYIQAHFFALLRPYIQAVYTGSVYRSPLYTSHIFGRKKCKKNIWLVYRGDRYTLPVYTACIYGRKSAKSAPVYTGHIYGPHIRAIRVVCTRLKGEPTKLDSPGKQLLKCYSVSALGKVIISGILFGYTMWVVLWYWYSVCIFNLCRLLSLSIYTRSFISVLSIDGHWCVLCRLVLLIIETLSLMLRESEIFACRTSCLKSEGGANVRELITLLVKRPISIDPLFHSQQVCGHAA